MSAPVKDALIYSNREANVTVYRGTWKQGTIPVVIKEQIHTDLQTANAAINEALSQIKLDHPNICKLYTCYLEDEPSGRVKSVLVIESMSHDFAKEIVNRRLNGMYWTEYELIYHLREVASALAYAQSVFVSHRDIKPNNIFLSTEGIFKVGDFGSSKKNADLSLTETLQGSPLYLSPELKRTFALKMAGIHPNSAYDPFKSDVYSLGLTFLQAARLSPPVEMMIVQKLPDATQKVIEEYAFSPTFQQLFAGMLAIDPEQRWSFEDVFRCTDWYMTSMTSLEEPRRDQDEGGNVEEKRAEVEQTEEIHQKKCVNCEENVDLSQSENIEFIPLACLHVFHSKDCFFQFLKENYKKFMKKGIVFCPVCQEAIRREDIPDDRGQKIMKSLQTPANSCSQCENKKPEYKFEGCWHKVCRACHRRNPKTENFDCPICSG